jgi:methylenetetrahydrofolate--tRNA-(uracil-5-)-methyltransferase
VAEAGTRVVLHEMRPVRGTEAHQTEALAELVCSNSLRSDDAENNAVGLLHEEMRRAGSLVLRAADAHRLPAGGALAVDRHGFSDAITRALEEHANIEIQREEVAEPPREWENAIIATGPLTSPALAAFIRGLTDCEALSFFDAMAPIVHRETVDMNIAWMQSRYDKGDGADYINCPLDEAQYQAFVDALLAGEKTEFKEWEKSTPYFEGCLPVEVMASRGIDTLRYGPMKPVGLRDPRQERRPHAVVQLRQASRGWADFIATPSSTPLACSMRNCGCGRGPRCASRARSPAWKAMWKARPSGFSPAVSRREKPSHRRPPPRSAPCSATSRAARKRRPSSR